MRVSSTAAEVAAWRAGQPGAVGLAPTMGALHDGHRALIERAVAECDAVAVSIFVNPLQFGAGEDYERYPRDMEADLELCRQLGVAHVFAPEQKEMYPPGHALRVEVGPIGAVLEGARRPGHFAGVATVVVKLLNLIAPRRAYFGMKDLQQLAVIKAVTRELMMAVELVAVPTAREPGGLARSSRNAYLSAEERAAAEVLHRALAAARALWRRGAQSSAALRRGVPEMAGEEPLGELEYVAVVDPERFRAVEFAAEGAALVLAARAGDTRLIDNVLLEAG